MIEAVPQQPPYLQRQSNLIETKLPLAIQTEEEINQFTREQFGRIDTLEEFIIEFKKFFPDIVSYNQDQDSRFDPQKLREHKVACNIAAAVIGCWLEEKKSELKLNFFFLVKRGRQRNHTFIAITPQQLPQNQKELMDMTLDSFRRKNSGIVMEFYRLTDDLGLHKLHDPKEQGIQDVVMAVRTPTSPSPDIPELGYTFQSIQELVLYILADKSYRTTIDQRSRSNYS